MKKIIFITTVVFISIFASWDDTISGKTLQEEKVPVLTATAIINTGSKLLVNTATPQTEGNFLLEIPSINLTWVVKDISKEEETSESWGIPKKILDKWGVVRFPHFAYPGQPGVVALAGHRDMSGLPFIFLDKIQKGDDIYISLENIKILYKVYNVLYVLPDETWVLEPQVSDEEIRLVTCLVGSTKKRLIIFGRKE